MNIHNIYAQIFKIWRARRMIKFEQLLQPRTDDILLDMGGYPETWTTRPQLTQRIDCLNVHPVRWNNSLSPNHRIVTTVGDGCALEYSDGSYDIVFSNSVIEHVGNWDRQCAFANEARRVGKKLWIQTPAVECPLEPHYLAPFVHWFTVRIRRRLLRWFTPWGWITRPKQEKIDETIASTRLLTKKQMRKLFPDCVVMTERLLWFFPKSYIAYRLNSEQGAAPDGNSAVLHSFDYAQDRLWPPAGPCRSSIEPIFDRATSISLREEILHEPLSYLLGDRR